MDYDLKIIIILILIIAFIPFVCNCCSADKWNEGICSDCNTRYELRGVTKYSKYYACPSCGSEVKRF